MPIEDVDYLKANSIKQSYVFLVDSADRDHAAYPHPSEYVVNFSAPFTNVVGMEVLDASIPRTMYNVDAAYNKITFLIHSSATVPGAAWAASAAATVALEPGEYTIQTLVPALTAVLQMHVDNDPDLPIATITAETVSTPPDTKNALRFRCPYPFFLDMGNSTLAETLGFDLLTTAFPRESGPLAYGSGATDAEKLAVRYTAPIPPDPLHPSGPTGGARVFHSVDLPFSVGSNALPTAEPFVGPRGVLRSLPLGTASDAGGGSQVAQRFTVPADTNLTQVFVALTTDAPLASYGGVTAPASLALGAAWEVRTGTATRPASAPGSGTTVSSGTIALSYTDGTLSDSNRVTARLTAGVYYWLILSPLPLPDGADPAAAANRLRVYYNDILATETTLLTSPNAAGWSAPDPLPTPDADEIFFSISATVQTTDDYHRLTAPGIYSLVGPRYITLHCPEIEENAFRSLSYMRHSLGLAKIRLGVVGYSENRLDYSNIPIREFHPIGRLTKITVRFNLPDGTLYDFKGVNHTITFAVHYYEPVQKQVFSRSIINPNYTGNVLEYMYRQEDQESDSTDQEEDHNRDGMEPLYRYRERNFAPENAERRDKAALYFMDRASAGPPLRPLDPRTGDIAPGFGSGPEQFGGSDADADADADTDGSEANAAEYFRQTMSIGARAAAFGEGAEYGDGDGDGDGDGKSAGSSAESLNYHFA
jgi:hypothetical protein